MKFRLRIARTVPAPLAAALSCLGLLVFAHPAHAGSYVFVGTEVINGATSTLTFRAGATSMGLSAAVSSSSPGVTYTPASGSTPPQYNMNSSVTFTFTATWTPSYPGDTSIPPTNSNFLETATTSTISESTQYGGPLGSLPPPTATSDDGLGDTATTSVSSSPGESSITSTGTGKHLVSQSGNTITITATMTGTATSDSSVVSHAALIVAVDTRSVSISTSLPQTNTKPTTAPDGGWFAAVPVPDSTQGNPIYVDTVAPAPPTLLTIPSLSIGYTASPIGNWNTNSSYLWNFSLSGYSTGATFNPGSIAGVTNEYFASNASPGSQDHAYIHLTDSVDGANGTGNLYVRFHNQWEDFQPYTTPYEVENQTFAYPTGVENNGSTPITPAFTETIDNTVSLAVGLQGGFTVANLASFGVSYTSTEAVSSSGAVTAPGPTLQPGFESTPELFCSWNRNIYMVDEYGSSGYIGTIEQTVDVLPVTQNLGWSTPVSIH